MAARLFTALDGLLDPCDQVVTALTRVYLGRLDPGYVSAALSRTDVLDGIKDSCFVPHDLPQLKAAAAANNITLLFKGCTLIGWRRREVRHGEGS